MTAASRTSGVAPLAVFFDAVNTTSPAWTSGVVQPSDGDYASFNYQWNFGDPTSGNWGLGRRNPDGTYPSKNTATGYTAMHVFEKPGTYTVALTVTQTDGIVRNYTQSVTVSAFSGTTYYVSSSGNDNNAGTSPNAPLAGFTKAMSKLATNTRILFKRGESWNITSGGTLPANGPGIIGAYYNSDGSDDSSKSRPKIVLSGSGRVFTLTSSSDWRIVDLDLQGDKTGYGIWYVKNNDLILRCSFSQFADGIVLDAPASNLAISDSQFLNNLHYGAYLDGGAHQAVFRGAIMGSLFDQSDAHLLRPYINKALITHNDFQRTAITQIKFCGALAPTEVAYGIIADNKFWNHQGAWLVSVGPEDNLPNQYEIVHDLVIERNIWDLSQESGGTPLQSRGADRVTVRNNLFLGGQYALYVSEGVQGFSTWTDWRVHNNTYFRPKNPDTEESVFIRWVNSVGHNWKVFNNLVSFPNAVDGHIFWGPAEMLANMSSDNNEFFVPLTTDMSYIGANSYTMASWPTTGKDTHSKVGDPLFANAALLDLRLKSTSPAINSGVKVSGLFEDFDGASRPQGAGYDIGAYEYKSGTAGSSSSSAISSSGSSSSNSSASSVSSVSSSISSFAPTQSSSSSFAPSSSAGSSQGSAPSSASGLAAHWKLDEASGAIAADSSGNNNTGTLQNSPIWGVGRTNGALSLNGSQYVSIADASSLRLSSSYTLASWIKPQALGGYGTILIKESLTTGGCGYWLQTNGTEVSAGFNNGSTCAEHLSSGAGLQTGQWYHVAAVFDDPANTFKIYVNGVQKNSANQAETGAPSSNTHPLYLGRTSQSNEYFNGSLDDVRVYNRALSAAEIQNLYLPTNSPPQITLQPQDRIVDEGLTATFTAAATGSGTLAYQWQKNGVNITGATAASYTTPTLALADSGASYRVVVSNAYGNVTSNAALLTVNKATSVAWPLRINAAGRYFEDQTGNPFLISGEAGWLVATQISQEDAVTYLDNIKAKGFNAVELMMISTFQNNTPNNYYNEPPFTNGPINWSVRNESYWARVDFVLMQLRMRGMVALAFPAYLGYECGSEGWCQQMLAQTDTVMNNYGQWIGNRYKDYGNIIWMTGGDVDASQHGQAAGRNAAIVSGIRSADTDAIFSAEPHSDQVGGIDSYATLLNVNSVYTYGHPQSMVQRAFNSSIRPFIFQEGYYENEYSTPTVYQDAQALITYLGGGLGGHIFGSCPLWGFGTSRDSRCPLTAPYFDTWRHSMESPGSVGQGAIARLMRSRKWWTMSPDYSNAVVTSAKGSEMDYHATASNGETIMVWAPNTSSITVNTTRIGGTSMRVWWFNTADGSSSLIGTYATGTMSFTPTAGRKVLVIDNAALNLPAPGTSVYNQGSSSISSSTSSSLRSSSSSLSSSLSSSASSTSSEPPRLSSSSSSSISSSVQSSAQSSSRSSALSSSSSISSTASSNSSSSLSSSSSSVLSLNPVLDMRFDEPPSAGAVKDSSQYANNGSCIPGVSCPVISSDDAYTFDGANDAVTVQNTVPFNFDRYTPFTLSAWVSNLVPSNCAPIVAKGLAAANKAYKGYALNLDCLNGTRLELSLIQSSTKRQAIIVTGSTNITAPGWHHVVATYDGTNKPSGIKLYVDGALETPSRQSGSLKGSISTSYPLKIGSSSQPLFLTGMVDEVKVFNRALDAALIRQIHMTRAAITSQTNVSFASVAVKSSTTSALDISALVTNPDEIKAVYMTISSYGLRTAVQNRSQRSNIRLKLKRQASVSGQALYGGTLELQDRLLALRGRVRVTIYALTHSGAVIAYSKPSPQTVK